VGLALAGFASLVLHADGTGRSGNAEPAGGARLAQADNSAAKANGSALRSARRRPSDETCGFMGFR